MIDVAKSVTAPPAPHIDWHVGDAASLPLARRLVRRRPVPDGADVHGGPSPRRWPRCAASLVPGGRVVVNTPGAIQPPFELMEQAIVDHISPELGGFVRAVFSMHDPDALAALLRERACTDVVRTRVRPRRSASRRRRSSSGSTST